MSKKNNSGIVRIEIPCIFRDFAGSRAFVTPHNNEAVNMLMNKLDKNGIAAQPGKLVFEFNPDKAPNRYTSREKIRKQICVCGHNMRAHCKSRAIQYSIGRCLVSGCRCKRYTEKPSD